MADIVEGRQKQLLRKIHGKSKLFNSLVSKIETLHVTCYSDLRKFGIKSIDPKNFGCDVSVQTLGEAEGSPKATRPEVENAIFSWREIARCFWATGAFLGGKSHDHRPF